jgi:glucose/arabinose dehydrogenase/mono/diheme cytochrome c family protein
MLQFSHSGVVFNMLKSLSAFIACLVVPLTTLAGEHLVYEGESGPGKGKHIVFIASDHEYNSEEACPMLARLLAKRFGFKCTVLFGLDDQGFIQNGSNHIPGMENLKDADLAFLFLRFQDWDDEQMGHFVAYLDRAGPIIGLRTTTHAFQFKKNGPYAKYSNSYNGEDYKGGFGRQILGEKWAGHYGGNHKSSTRIDIVPEKKDHPILRGVKDAWAYCGGYQANPLQPSEVLAMAQPLKGIHPNDSADPSFPPVPAAWTRTYEGKGGKTGRVFTTTYGASPDFENEGFRRMVVNACFWALGMEDEIKADFDVDIVGPYNSTFAKAVKRKRATNVKPLDMAGWDTPIVPLQPKQDTSQGVLFDGTSTERLNIFDWKMEENVLRGSGKLVGVKKPLTNFELRIRFKYLKEYGSLSINEVKVPEYRLSQKTKDELVGKWRDLRLTFRHMRNEQVRLENLTPVGNGRGESVVYSGKHVRLSPDHGDDKLKIGKDGYVEGQAERPKFFFDGEVEIARIEILPLSPDSPREYILLSGKELDQSVQGGAKLFKLYCHNCHGDGKTPLNPLARSFATEPLVKGADLHSIFITLSTGYQTMPAISSLSVEQRFQLAHFLREKIFKPHNPKNVVDVSPDVFDALPYPLYTLEEKRTRKQENTGEALAKKEGRFRDHGPAMICANGNARNAMQVKLSGRTTISYDLNAMESLGVWHGSFMAMQGSHYYVGKGGRQPVANGTPIPELGKWRWAHEGNLDYPRIVKTGPLPFDGFRYLGHYLYDDKAVLSYQIDHRKILETPECIVDSKGERTLVQHLEIAPGDAPLLLGVGTAEGSAAPITDELRKSGTMALLVHGDREGLSWEVDKGWLAIRIPASKSVRRFAVIRSAGEEAAERAKAVSNTLQAADFKTLLTGGNRRWTTEHTLSGQLSDDTQSSYVVDTIQVPFENAYNSWMRTTSLAFFDDGRAVVTTYDGDVWIVSGIDDTLSSVTWSRFAAGLHEGFGCQIVDGKIMVTTRNGIVRLHDINNDGEADYYEQFFADPDFSLNFHGYNFDLIRDKQGYFYYSKNGQFTDITFDGGCYKISPDGKSYSMYGTGFRTPNGMGILPDGRVLMADNQGNWVPAGKISVLQPGKWYGGAWVRSKGEMPKTFEQPILWFPQDVDSSCGSQVWVDDERFGPYGKGLLFHTSCGIAKAMMVFVDDDAKQTQAAVQVFPFQFESGIMRPRVNPKDGQVYVTGTRGWGVHAPKDGCLQRVRYTGKPEPVLTDVKARSGVIELTFNQAVEINATNCRVEMWNYQWTQAYGSRKYSVRNPETTKPDDVEVTGVEINGNTIRIGVPDLLPAHQVKLTYRLEGKTTDDVVHLTVHAL